MFIFSVCFGQASISSTPAIRAEFTAHKVNANLRLSLRRGLGLNLSSSALAGKDRRTPLFQILLWVVCEESRSGRSSIAARRSETPSW